MMTYGSLFSGIGGLDLGLDRSGLFCKWQVENDEFCTNVLKMHWPAVRRYKDVRECGVENLDPVDLLAGGFPCQPFSRAGEVGRKKSHNEDDRNLWPEMLRIISELRPRWILAENVLELQRVYLDVVLSDLEDACYDAIPISLPAGAFGLPQIRERIFIVAYSNSQPQPPSKIQHSIPDQARTISEIERLWASWTYRTGSRGIRAIPDPGICRTFDGIPGRLDRYRAIGNSVSPIVAQFLGTLIQAADPSTIDHQ